MSGMRMNTDREHSGKQTKTSRWGFRGMTVRDWLPLVAALLAPVVIILGIWGITWQLEKLENQRAKAEHNKSVTHFLINSGLSVRTKDSVRLLRGSTLSHATLSGAHLPNADLGDADLIGADLSNALLLNANLIGADLSGADLSNALLDNADLVAHLPHADLSGADLIGADLSEANLFSADLSDANLIGADLSRSVLDNANLSNAVLDNANLGGADGITNEELEQQAVSLEGADMPNGQKYEDWLKSVLRKEDGKNDGSS
jgi:hypothetical protein